MPERPELDHAARSLAACLPGQRIERVELRDPVVLRVAVAGDWRALLPGRRITGVCRRGHFLLLSLDGSPPLELAIHPMLAGRLDWGPAERPPAAAEALRLVLSDGQALRYRDSRQMGKVYLLDPAARERAPGLAKVGLDVLSPAFTAAAFEQLCRGRREQVKTFLLDKSALDALGNAYADEALHRAGLHPKLRVRELDAAQRARLHAAIPAVLREAAEQIADLQPGIDEKPRDWLAVRNRAGQPCPTCGAPVRVVGVNGHDAFFCPQCQPDTQARGFVDWRRLPPA